MDKQDLYGYSVDEVSKIVKECFSIRELIIKLKGTQGGGNCYKKVYNFLSQHKIDYSHFLGQGLKGKNKKPKIPIETYLTNAVKITSYKLKNKLFEEGIFERKCMKCKNILWLNEPIPLELHHKDGNKNNNQIDNLEILCPNCHCFTDTYKTKNIKSKKK